MSAWRLTLHTSYYCRGSLPAYYNDYRQQQTDHHHDEESDIRDPQAHPAGQPSITFTFEVPTAALRPSWEPMTRPLGEQFY